MAPPNSRSFSVSVVLPASGWEMMANVRRRATSDANGVTTTPSVATTSTGTLRDLFMASMSQIEAAKSRRPWRAWQLVVDSYRKSAMGTATPAHLDWARQTGGGRRDLLLGNGNRVGVDRSWARADRRPQTQFRPIRTGRPPPESAPGSSRQIRRQGIRGRHLQYRRTCKAAPNEAPR